MKTKIKSHGDEVTDFYYKEILNVDPNHTYILLYHTVLMKDDNYYLYVFLKECKYIEKKVIRYTNTNLSGFSSFDESDEE